MKTVSVALWKVRLVALGALLSTFSAGVFTGSRLCAEPPPVLVPGPPPPGLPLPGRVPVERLSLSAEQDARVRAIVASHGNEFEAVVIGTFPQIRAINARIEQEIRAILTPEQRRRLDAIQAEAGETAMGGGRW